jgi:hypothetical protein
MGQGLVWAAYKGQLLEIYLSPEWFVSDYICTTVVSSLCYMVTLLKSTQDLHRLVDRYT